jgi:hypothetical protein
VEQGELLDLLRTHRGFGRPGLGQAHMGDEAFPRRHARRDGACQIDEAQVAGGQHSVHAPLLVDHDQRSDAGAPHAGGRLGERRLRSDGVRVVDDAVLGALDDLDLAHLRLDLAAAEAAVDDADAALFRDGDGHVRAGHRVHVGRHDRPLHRDVLRKPGRQVDRRRIAALEDAELGGEEEVVKGAASDEIKKITHGTGHGDTESRR